MSPGSPGRNVGLAQRCWAEEVEMRLSVDTTLLDKAQQLAPLIREHAAEADCQRRLSRPVVEALARAGLLRMYVPKSLGVLETDPVTCTRVIEAVSAADTAAGWLLWVNTGP